MHERKGERYGERGEDKGRKEGKGRNHYSVGRMVYSNIGEW